MMRGDQRLIVFSLAGQDCALPVDAVREILPIPRLATPPGTVGGVEGFLVLDGETIPVIDLARLLGAPPTKIGLYTPLLVVDHAQPFALLVERVREIAAVPADAVLHVDANRTDHGCLAAEVRWQDGTLHLLSIDALHARGVTA